MRTKIACLGALLATSVASAQPGPPSGPDGQPPPPPAPGTPPPQPGYGPPPSQPGYGPPAGYAPGAYGYRQPPPGSLVLQLSPDDQELLTRGEISDGQWLVGGLASVVLGFGIGQAVEGRWLDRGWIFTVGEGASIVAIVAGAVEGVDCSNSVNGGRCNNGIGLVVGGVLAFTGLRVWEIVDAFAVPPSQNAHIREMRVRLGLPPQQVGYTLAPFIAPVRGLGANNTTVAGLQLRF
jgi:hypothetical protein